MVYSMTASTCSLVTPGNHDRNSSTEAPPSRFSNNATTGTRVLRKTHEPLTFSGSRPTAGHEDQFIIDEPYSLSFAKGKRGGALVEFEQIVTLAGAAEVLDFNKQSGTLITLSSQTWREVGATKVNTFPFSSEFTASRSF